MKVCKTCGTVKDLDHFYAHKKMADGHLNHCIECVKAREIKRRNDNIEKIRAYDRARANDPKRVQARKEYAQSQSGKQAHKRAMEKYKEKFPIKRAAHMIFGNAVKNGKIIRADSCSECKSKVKIEGHHDDYSKPLEVRWLCEKCHKAWHKYNEPVYLGNSTGDLR